MKDDVINNCNWSNKDYNWSIRERRSISATTYFLDNLEKNIYINKLLCRKIKFIKIHYRNYKQKQNNKLQNSIKRLFFNKIFNDKIIANDIIIQIFESRKILK